MDMFSELIPEGKGSKMYQFNNQKGTGIHSSHCMFNKSGETSWADKLETSYMEVLLWESLKLTQ